MIRLDDNNVYAVDTENGDYLEREPLHRDQYQVTFWIRNRNQRALLTCVVEQNSNVMQDGKLVNPTESTCHLIDAWIPSPVDWSVVTKDISPEQIERFRTFMEVHVRRPYYRPIPNFNFFDERKLVGAKNE